MIFPYCFELMVSVRGGDRELTGGEGWLDRAGGGSALMYIDRRAAIHQSVSSLHSTGGSRRRPLLFPFFFSQSPSRFLFVSPAEQTVRQK